MFSAVQRDVEADDDDDDDDVEQDICAVTVQEMEKKISLLLMKCILADTVSPFFPIRYPSQDSIRSFGLRSASRTR